MSTSDCGEKRQPVLSAEYQQATGHQLGLLAVHHHILLQTWKQQHWWPARTRFEVIVGAFLTQNTSWTNVETSLRSLRNAGILSPKGVRSTSLTRLESLIRSAGYFRQKARNLKTFVAFLDQRYGGSLPRMFAQTTDKLRPELLALNGVGPETADSILLYAGQHPVFVVDTYTRRILHRHGLASDTTDYESIRTLFEQALSPIAASTRTGNLKPEIAPSHPAHRPSAMSLARRTPVAHVYNEMHALIVAVGKNYCRKSEPRCSMCPLQKFFPTFESLAGATSRL